MPTGLTYHVPVTATRKFALTALLFALALVMVALAAATHVVAPLFAAWAPLLVVPWILTRPEPGEVLAGPSPRRDAAGDEGTADQEPEDSGDDQGERRDEGSPPSDEPTR